MRTVRMLLGTVVCAGVFALGAAAQDPMPQHEHDMSKMNMNLPGHDMGMGAKTDVSALFEKMNKNLAALQTEKKGAARKQLLADQAAMLKELKAKVGGGGGMAGMGDMMCCKGMDMKGMDMKGGGCGMQDMKMPDSKIPEAPAK